MFAIFNEDPYLYKRKHGQKLVAKNMDKTIYSDTN